ncbi:MAG: serine/threonine protein phosphatase [Sphingomonadales bacterium]|nr:MAG: serine/threonine protein phosphatase [Sphingomonadales bacterium]
MSIYRLALSVALAATAAALPLSAQAEGYRDGQCGPFTIAVIPDTQNYMDYSHQKWSGFAFDATELYYDQMRWIRANARSAGGDIVFASHVGDVWQHYSAWMDPGHAARGFNWVPNAGSTVAVSPKVHTKAFEIPAAKLGFDLISGALPFSVVPGNHDYDALWTDPRDPPRPAEKYNGRRHVGGLTGYQSAFSDQSGFFKGRDWYVGAHDGGADSAQVFTAGKCRFLHIGLQYHAPDASLRWAAEIVKRHPGLPTIVSTHDYLARNGKRNHASNPTNRLADPIDNEPQMMWDEFISQHDQIIMVLSGHVGGQGFSTVKNRNGRDVYQIMADYQGRGQTAIDAGAPPTSVGDGWLRLMQFNLDGDKPQVRIRTYSTHYKGFSSDLPQYAEWYKTKDGQKKLTDAEYLARDEFTIALTEFHARFAAASAPKVAK